MILLYVDKITEEKCRVLGVNYFPYEVNRRVPDSVIENNILVDNVLNPVEKVGKDAIHYINPQTLEQWYEYVDRPLSYEEQIQELKAQNAQMLLALVQGGLI